MNKNKCSFNYNFSIGIGSTFLILLCALLLICSCIIRAQDSSAKLFFDKEVTFKSGSNEIFGILTLPTTKGPHPAIVLLHGSDRAGVDSPYYKDHSYNLVQSGFAVLRYDGPGWGGRSSGSPGFETLEYRTQEAISAVKYLQSRADIKSAAVGLWGISQGGWICQMAAASYDQIAFIIPVSGPGVTPAEQEVYRVEMQSRAMGFSEDEIAKAVLFRRLMVDVFLLEPKYEAVNYDQAKRLGEGPWNELIELVYSQDLIDPGQELGSLNKIFTAIKDEPWTKFLHLEQVLPMFKSLPPEQWEVVKLQLRSLMIVDQADYLTKVHSPVLAIFGQDDTSVPVAKSVALYEQYLREAGNKNVMIKVFPNATHSIYVKGEFAPGYFETISDWLRGLSLE